MSPTENANTTKHLGDPCIHCGVAHNDVDPGNCPSAFGLAAIVREKSHFEALLSQHEKHAADHTAYLKGKISSLSTDICRIESGLDLEKINLAQAVLYVIGDYAKAGDDRDGARQDAIRWLSGVETLNAYKGNLKQEYFGTKSYDRWHGQRADHSYGMGPRHGSIIFQIGLVREARSRDLTPEEREAAVYYLLNLERVQASKDRK